MRKIKKHKHIKIPVTQETLKAQMHKIDEAYKAVAPDPNRRQSTRRAPINILQTAEALVYGVRNKTYRHPTENFENIANLWNAYFEAIKVRPEVLTHGISVAGSDPVWFKINRIDVAYMNILQKIARGATNQEHEDTIVDIAGYAGCIERIVKNK